MIRIPAVPARTQNDDLSAEVLPPESLFDRDEPLHLFTKRPPVCIRVVRAAPLFSYLNEMAFGQVSRSQTRWLTTCN